MRYEFADHEWIAIKPMLPQTTFFQLGTKWTELNLNCAEPYGDWKMNATYQFATALLTFTLAVGMFVSAQFYTAHRASKDPVPQILFSTVRF